MTNNSPPPFPEVAHRWADALAVIVCGTADELSALLGEPVSLATLANLPQVARQGDFVTIAEARARRQGLDLAQLTAWEAAYIDFCLERDHPPSPAFAGVFERHGNRLIVSDPAALHSLAEDVLAYPHSDEEARHWALYFQSVTLSKREEFAQSIATIDRLLTLPISNRLRGRALNTRAVNTFHLGDIQAALDGYQASLRALLRTHDQRSIGVTRMNLAILQYELRRYPEAEQMLDQARAAFELAEEANWIASVDNEKGLMLRDQGHWERAADHFRRFIAYNEAMDNTDYVAIGLNNLSEVLTFQNRLSEAQEALQRALTLIESRAYRIDTLIALGLIAELENRNGAAAAHYSQALALAEQIERRGMLPAIYLRLGLLAQRQGVQSEARRWLRLSVEAVEATRAPLHSATLKIALLGRWQQPYESLLLLHLAAGDDEAALTVAEQARARAFAEAVVDQSPNELPRLQTHLAGDEEALLFFTTGMLEQDMPMLRQIDPALAPHLLTPPRTLCFHVTARSVRCRDCQIDPNQFVSQHDHQHGPDRWLKSRVVARVYAALFSELALQTERLIVVPHGPLHHLPLSAILHHRDSRIQNVRYTPSGAFLQSAPRPMPDDRYCGVAYRGDPPLHLTRHELRAAAKHWPSTMWLDGADDLDALRHAAQDAAWLHFACHGWFNEEQPMASYLDVAPESRLTAQQIMTWSLKADLVVLSACRTGVSRVLRGDEPMGLVRAFLQAGAQSVIVTQWQVEDIPSFLLITELFERLQQERDLGAALHGAQQWLRHADQETLNRRLPDGITVGSHGRGAPFAHPRYWAAFTLWGRR